MGTETPTGKLRIQQLYVYPIKSLRGIRLPSVSATTSGFVYDRSFMLWDVSKSEPMHIGLRPAMCLFTTSFDSPTNPKTVEVAFGVDAAPEKLDDKLDHTTLSVPLCPRTEGLEQFHMTMHKSPAMAYDMGARYNDWFSVRFGYKVKLLYIGKNRRKVLGNLPPKEPSGDVSIPALFTMLAGLAVAVLLYTDKISSPVALASLSAVLLTVVVLFSRIGPSALTSFLGSESKANITFADLAPFLVISTQSLENVQARLPEGAILDVTKFRPNIVVDGAAEAFDEDFWAELRIGNDTRMTLTQNCARCNSLNVDYTTGKIAPDETGKVLKLLSKDRRVDPGTKWSPVFGRYGFLATGSASHDDIVLHEGDDVRISARNQERTIMDYPK